MKELTIQQKKDYAKQLYMSEAGITQMEIADRVGANKGTICKWVKEGKWEELQTSLLVEKEVQLSRLYKQLKALNDAVEKRPAGEQFMQHKEADTLVKITASIKNLETETNTAEKMATGKEFLSFVRKTTDFQTSKEIARLFNAYIKTCL